MSGKGGAMTNERRVAGIRAQVESGEVFEFPEEEDFRAVFAALDAAEAERDALRAQLNEKLAAINQLLVERDVARRDARHWLEHGPKLREAVLQLKTQATDYDDLHRRVDELEAALAASEEPTHKENN